MKIIKELDQSERLALRKHHRDHILFNSHVKIVLDKAHCFRVNLFPDDYDKILIYSCLPNVAERPYQPMSKAIAHIILNPDFLKGSISGCLYGERVQHYLVQLRASQHQLQDCFTKMGDCFMLDNDTPGKMRNEITDGMHRLVAYGLASDMNESQFPIPIYYGTDKTSSLVEAVRYAAD